MPKKESTNKLYKDIREEYHKLANVQEFGEKKYKDRWIFAKLGIKFYKSKRHIENIVYFRVA